MRRGSDEDAQRKENTVVPVYVRMCIISGICGGFSSVLAKFSLKGVQSDILYARYAASDLWPSLAPLDSPTNTFDFPDYLKGDDISANLSVLSQKTSQKPNNKGNTYSFFCMVDRLFYKNFSTYHPVSLNGSLNYTNEFVLKKHYDCYQPMSSVEHEMLGFYGYLGIVDRLLNPGEAYFIDVLIPPLTDNEIADDISHLKRLPVTITTDYTQSHYTIPSSNYPLILALTVLTVRALAILSFLFLNSVMLTFLVAALNTASSAFQATVTNFAISFLCSSFFGYLFFGEGPANPTSLNWAKRLGGIVIMLIGVYFLGTSNTHLKTT